MVSKHHFQPQNLVFQPQNTQPTNFSGQPRNKKSFGLWPDHFLHKLMTFYGTPLIVIVMVIENIAINAVLAH